MLWEMRLYLHHDQKSQIQKIRNQRWRLTCFSDTVAFRCTTQQNSMSGPGFYISGKHDFSKAATNSEKPILQLSDSGNQNLRSPRAGKAPKHRGCAKQEEMTGASKVLPSLHAVSPQTRSKLNQTHLNNPENRFKRRGK